MRKESDIIVVEETDIIVFRYADGAKDELLEKTKELIDKNMKLGIFHISGINIIILEGRLKQGIKQE